MEDKKMNAWTAASGELPKQNPEPQFVLAAVLYTLVYIET
jgi:hypothetical protein